MDPSLFLLAFVRFFAAQHVFLTPFEGGEALHLPVNVYC